MDTTEKRNRDEVIRLIQREESTIKEYKRHLKATHKSHDEYEKMLVEVPKEVFGDKYDEIARLVKEDADLVSQMDTKLSEMEKALDELKASVGDEGNCN
jgi:hypothetical protein